MKRITAAFLDDRIYLQPEGRTESWLWVYIGKVSTFTISLSNEEIGRGLLEALNQSRENVPKPQKMDGPGEIATLAGYKTWISFAKKAKLVTILQESKGIEFWPTSWAGVKNGNLILEEKAFAIDNIEPELVGESLRKAINLC